MRGLINLNLGSPDDLFALLGIFGVAAEDRGPLIAKLQDYIDADSFIRLNGAEAPQYEEAGLEPPANAPLRTPWEVRRILDWDKVDDLAKEDSGWSLMTSTAPIGGFNVNTAPRALLSLMPLMTPDIVDSIIERRHEQPFVSGYQFGLLTGIPISDVPPPRFVPFPGNGIILTLSTKNSPLERRIAVHKTPLSPDRPWTVDYVNGRRLGAVAATGSSAGRYAHFGCSACLTRNGEDSRTSSHSRSGNGLLMRNSASTCI